MGFSCAQGRGLLFFLVLTGCTGSVEPSNSGELAPDPEVGPRQGDPSPRPQPDAGRPESSPAPDARPPPPTRGEVEGDPVTLNQALLFSPGQEPVTYTSARYWRLSALQFVNTAHAYAGSSQARIRDPFGFTPAARSFNNYAASFTVRESQLAGVLREGRRAALWALRDNKLPGCARNAYRNAVDIEPSDPLGDDGFPESCQSAVIRYFYVRAVGRDPTEAESERLVATMTALTRSLGVARGVIASQTLLFAEPTYLFRTEVGTAVEGEDRARLSAYELGRALAYTIRNQSPFRAKITDVMEDGSLLDREVLRGTVRELLGAEGPNADYVRNMVAFLREYFQYDAGSGIQKDGPNGGGGRWNRYASEIQWFVEHLVEQDERFIARLLTSTDKIVDRDGTVEPVPDRPGILHREAWLWSFSQNEENDPIKRGHFIREHLLCLDIPDIPIDVIPLLPEAPEATLRERLAEHSSNPFCVDCHERMDPLGLPFERFDHFSMWRDEEKGRPVDTTGAFIRTRGLDGTVENGRELVTALAGAEEVERCFIRHLFRYLMGRDETYGDAQTLADAHRAYQESGGRLRATVESLMMSDTMLYRALPAGQ